MVDGNNDLLLHYFLNVFLCRRMTLHSWETTYDTSLGVEIGGCLPYLGEQRVCSRHSMVHVAVPIPPVARNLAIFWLEGTGRSDLQL